MSNDYLNQVKKLVEIYGIEDVARRLEVTGRAIGYWLDERSPKTPGPATRRKISELFRTHDAGTTVQEPEAEYGSTAQELLALYRERIAELKEDKEWLKRTIDSNLMGLIFGQKSVLAHVATILEKDNEREAAGNKKKLEQLKDDTDKRIGEKFQIAARTDSVRT